MSETNENKREVQLSYSPSIPFNVNRYIVLVVLVIYVTFVGSHFFNWISWEEIFKNTGVYGHLCTASENDSGEFCTPRKQALDRLFFIVQASMFSFSFIAGLLLDILGPKLSCIIGNLLLTSGWGILYISPKNNSLYPLGFALMGAGTDTSFFGLISFSNVFPENPSFIISILGAARSVSNFIPKFFALLSRDQASFFTMKGISFSYIVFYLLCIIISLLLIPSKAYVSVELNEENQQQNVEMVFNPKTQNSISDSNEIDSANTSSNSKLHNFWLDAIYPIKMLLNPIYFPIVLYCILNIQRNSYYTTSAKDRLGPAVSLLETMTLLAFLPGPICGYLVHRFSPFAVMHGLNFSIGCTFVCTVIAYFCLNAGSTVGSNVFNYISTLFCLPFMGFILSQVYCYVAIVFEPKDLGKLVGFSSLVAGLCGLLSGYIIDFARRIGFVYVDVAYIIVTIASGFLLLFGSHKVNEYLEANNRGTPKHNEP